MPVTEFTAGQGVAFIVSAGIVAELIAKACSSPQTQEKNAKIRADTAMKWVNIGLAESILFVAIAAYIDPKHRNAIIAGGILEAVITYWEYGYAIKSGLASVLPATEEWNPEGAKDGVYEYSQA